MAFAGSAAEGIKLVFTVPACKVCAHWEQAEEKYLDEIRYLRDLIETERRERDKLYHHLMMALRLEAPSVSGLETTRIPTTPQRIQGIVSPMRQRNQAEIESRKKYWETKAKNSPPLSLGYGANE